MLRLCGRLQPAHSEGVDNDRSKGSAESVRYNVLRGAKPLRQKQRLTRFNRR